MSLELRKTVRINTLYEIVDDLDYYQLLKQNPDCKQSSIAPAFQAQSKAHHPDNAPSELKDKANYIFTAINEAFRILKEPQTRLEYDGLLKNLFEHQNILRNFLNDINVRMISPIDGNMTDIFYNLEWLKTRQM